MGINTLSIAHQFLREHIKPGSFCIDATAGRGHDTAFLCHLVGEHGHVLAFDIQKEAIDSTHDRLCAEEIRNRAQLILDSHSNMQRYAKPQSADAIVFNFGYLPGGDHHLFTTAKTSIPAIEQGLDILKPGGVMSLCIYYGKDSGYEERDALLEYLKTINQDIYTVLVTHFQNRRGDPPIPAFILKEI